MIFETLLSPLTLTILGIFAVFMIPLLILDRRRAQYNARFMRSIRTYLDANVRMSTSIIVHADGDAAKLRAFAEHLLDFDKTSLQLVILYAPKKRAQVRTLQRKYTGKLKISLVLDKDAKTTRQALKRQITGDTVYETTLDTRFAARFFDYISLELLDTSIDALVIDSTTHLDNRLTSAATVWTKVLHKIIRKLGLVKSSTLVYRKKSYFGKKATTKTSQSRAQILVPIDSTITSFGRVAGLASISLIAIAGIAAYMIFPITWLYVPIAVYLGLLLILFVNASALPYTPGKKALIVLVLPFWPLLAIPARAK